MFLSELSPVIQELLKQPLAFTSGFCSGLLRLDLNDEPLASWLNKQGFSNFDSNNSNHKSNQDQPQSITIE
ncbi:hypothetical protein Sta7437_3023 [Stanieria cyanosphaera PCC 7437]|uniref:Uncharacterized protein n=1 Tax=Stanieria cyanosphaera (strain ATCC 29371 / PCC 7437) TaxID=111780 RepID=K9XWT0_STAC7|nr:hypothetical protein [Stanieria cyanosphaera]AFZ36541.1 hypothetical protein Sta7437_3023 [Stanieria cyanosphaera PCC 7437]